jgi:hypothetical protein
LVQDLEAVPLAIVLAAGRLRHMSLQELAERGGVAVTPTARGAAGGKGRKMLSWLKRRREKLTRVDAKASACLRL